MHLGKPAEALSGLPNESTPFFAFRNNQNFSRRKFLTQTPRWKRCSLIAMLWQSDEAPKHTERGNSQRDQERRDTYGCALCHAWVSSRTFVICTVFGSLCALAVRTTRGLKASSLGALTPNSVMMNRFDHGAVQAISFFLQRRSREIKKCVTKCFNRGFCARPQA